jgi:hypothetical protein
MDPLDSEKLRDNVDELKDSRFSNLTGVQKKLISLIATRQNLSVDDAWSSDYYRRGMCSSRHCGINHHTSGF